MNELHYWDMVGTPNSKNNSEPELPVAPLLDYEEPSYNIRGASKVIRSTGQEVSNKKLQKCLRDWGCLLMVTIFLTFVMLIYFFSERLAIAIFKSGDPEALNVEDDLKWMGLRQDVDEAGGRASTAKYINSFSLDILFFGIMIFTMRLLNSYTAFTIDPIELGSMRKSSLLELADNGFPNLRKLLKKYYTVGLHKDGREKFYQK